MKTNINKTSFFSANLLIVGFMFFTTLTMFSQSQVYLFVKPDSYYCNGEVQVYPKCIDVPPIAQYFIQFGSNSIGPVTWSPVWTFNNLCYSGGTEQLIVTAVDSFSNVYTLIDANISLDPVNPNVSFNAQIVSDPLVIIESYRYPSGLNCDGEVGYIIQGGTNPVDVFLMNTFNNDSIALDFNGTNYFADSLCPANYMLLFRDGFLGSCSGNIISINPGDTTSGGGYNFNNPYFSYLFEIEPFFCLLTSTETCFDSCSGTVSLNYIGNPLYYQIYHQESNTYFFSNNITNACYGNYYGEIFHFTGKTSQCYAFVDSTYIYINFSITPPSSSSSADGAIQANLLTNGSDPISYLWSNNQTTSQITGLNPGIYCLTVSCAEGCYSSSCVELVSTSSINNHSLSFNPILVYQPNLQSLQISGINPDVIALIQLIDINGKILQTKTSSVSINFDMTNLPSGIYLVQFISKNLTDNLSHAIKFVKF